jgi:ArsR family transcriptional regulator
MLLPQLAVDVRENEIMDLVERATKVSCVMKALSHEARLRILCHLVAGPKSVTELQDLLSSDQPSVSNQLTRLRLENLVVSERVGKSIYYSLSDGNTANLIRVLHHIFCDSAVQIGGS